MDPGSHNLEVHDLANGNRILRHEGNMAFVVINCPPDEFNDIYALLHSVANHHDWLFHLVPPILFSEPYNLFLAVGCCNQSTLAEQVAKMFFRKTKVFVGDHVPPPNNTRTRRREPNPNRWAKRGMYLTPKFKRIIWSIIKFLPIFHNAKVRPLIDANYMFVSQNDNVIFSKFVNRETKTIEDDARDVKLLLTTLAREKARGCVTIRMELTDLGNWCIATLFGGIAPSSPHDAFAKVAFWSPRNRIHYVHLLYNYVASGINEGWNVFQESSDAFKVDQETNWRTVIMSQYYDNPVLHKCLDIAQEYYDDEVNEGRTPSYFRDPEMVNFSDIDIFICGIYRLRDTFCHFIKQADNYAGPYEGEMNANNFQGVFQHLFPSHMIELAKAYRCFNYDATNAVVTELTVFDSQEENDESSGDEED